MRLSQANLQEAPQNSEKNIQNKAHVEEAKSSKNQTPKKMEPITVGYGHVGDSNLHLNVCTPSYSSETLQILEPWVYEWTRDKKGSVSAEHGIGIAKRNFLEFSKSKIAVSKMKSIKKLFDPNGILNPYCMFGEEDS